MANRHLHLQRVSALGNDAPQSRSVEPKTCPLSTNVVTCCSLNHRKKKNSNENLFLGQLKTNLLQSRILEFSSWTSEMRSQQLKNCSVLRLTSSEFDSNQRVEGKRNKLKAEKINNNLLTGFLFVREAKWTSPRLSGTPSLP